MRIKVECLPQLKQYQKASIGKPMCLKYLEEHHSLKGFCLENLRLVLIARNMIHLPSRHKDIEGSVFCGSRTRKY